MKNALQFFKKESLSNRAVEICGFLGEKDGKLSYKIVQNKHSDPANYFAIDPLDFLLFKRLFKMIAIFHSHLLGDSSASEFDKVNSENTTLPFLIFSIPENAFSVYVPPNCEVEKKIIEKLESSL